MVNSTLPSTARLNNSLFSSRLKVKPSNSEDINIVNTFDGKFEGRVFLFQCFTQVILLEVADEWVGDQTPITFVLDELPIDVEVAEHRTAEDPQVDQRHCCEKNDCDEHTQRCRHGMVNLHIEGVFLEVA
jgi:hypothetical protein